VALFGRARQGLGGREKGILEQLQKLMDPAGNGRNYREVFDKVAKPPALPFFRTRWSAAPRPQGTSAR